MADNTELKWLSDTVLVFKNMTGVDINLSLEDLQALPNLEAAYVQVMQAFIERQIRFAPDAPIDELKVLVNTLRITSKGFADYQIPGKLHCPIHLVRAQEKMPNVEFEDSREAWGWSECTHAKVEELWVPGTHGTMITVPHSTVTWRKWGIRYTTWQATLSSPLSYCTLSAPSNTTSSTKTVRYGGCLVPKSERGAAAPRWPAAVRQYFVARSPTPTIRKPTRKRFAI